MKPIEEMNAMEVCAYMVAKSSKGLLGEAELRLLYDAHCAKLKKELAARDVGEVSAEFKRELYAEVDAEAGKERGQCGSPSSSR